MSKNSLQPFCCVGKHLGGGIITNGRFHVTARLNYLTVTPPQSVSCLREYFN